MAATTVSPINIFVDSTKSSTTTSTRSSLTTSPALTTTRTTTASTVSSSSSVSSSSLDSLASATEVSTALNNPSSSSSSSIFPSNSTQSHSSTHTTSSVQHTTSTSVPGTSLAAVSATATPQSKDTPSWMTTPIFSGVVAGSFVLGALIAGLFVFALSRRRFKRSQKVKSSNDLPDHDHTYSGGKASAMSTVTTLAEPTYLPQLTEDAEAKRRILSLTDQIDQHVENFYRTAKVHVDETVENSIYPFETRQMPNPLAACFETATHPLVLIRHCLAFHIFSQTVAPGEDAELILPAEVAGMVSGMYHKSLSPATPQDTVAAFSLWKNLTGYLRPDLVAGTASTRATSDAANRFARQFSRAFSAWSNPQYIENHRIEHLAALVDQAIDTGTWVFSQPDNFRFTWNTLTYNGRNSNTKLMTREAVVVPGIFKMTHAGILLGGQGQSLVQPVVRAF